MSVNDCEKEKAEERERKRHIQRDGQREREKWLKRIGTKRNEHIEISKERRK